MSFSKLMKAFDVINSNDSDFCGIKSDSLIEKAENELGIYFPPNYKKFLSEFGCGDILGFEIYGIIDENFTSSAIPNGIWLTLTERQSGLPENFIIIGSDDMGRYFALNSLEKVGDEYKVVLLYDNDIVEHIADDFGSFLYTSLNDLL